MKYENQTFENETIIIDDNEYRNCKFIECKIVYSGSEHVVLEHNQFIKPRFVFLKGASAAVRLLKHFYENSDTPYKKSIEEIFAEITEDDDE